MRLGNEGHLNSRDTHRAIHCEVYEHIFLEYALCPRTSGVS